MVTQLYSDVASRPTRNRWATRLSVARPQSAGADAGLETKRSARLPPLRGYVLVDYSSSNQAHRVKI